MVRFCGILIPQIRCGNEDLRPGIIQNLCDLPHLKRILRLEASRKYLSEVPMTYTGRFASLIALFLIGMVSFAAAQTLATAAQLSEQGSKFSVAKQYDKAVEAFQEAIRLDAGLASAHAGLGATMIGMGRSADAIAPLKIAASLDPDRSLTFLNLGIAYSNLRRLDESITALTEALRLSPKDPRVLSFLGIVSGNAGKFEDSINYYKKAREIVPDDLSNFHNIGITYNRMGRYADGIEPLKTVTRRAPGNKSAWFNLGISYSRSGHYSDATDAFSKLLDLAPDDQVGLINRSWNYIYQGNFGREAARDAQKYTTLYGWRTSGSPYQGIVAIIGFRMAGMEPEAQSAILQAQKNIGPGVWAANIVRHFAGDISADELLKAAASNDQRTEAHAYIGLDLRIKNRSTDAKPHFQWAKEFGNANFVEYTLAIAELARIGN